MYPFPFAVAHDFVKVFEVAAVFRGGSCTVQHHNNSRIQHRRYGTGPVRYIACGSGQPQLLKNPFMVLAQAGEEPMYVGQPPRIVVKGHGVLKY